MQKIVNSKDINEADSLKSFFLPKGSGANNPYQDRLIDGLKQLNVTIVGLGFNSIFFHTILFERRPIILHIHWLHAFFIKSNRAKSLLGLVLFLSQLLILKLVGVKIVWTAHNLKNHDNRYPSLDKIGTSAVAKLAHAIIAHSESARDEVIESFGLKDKSKVFSVPHGNYIGSYPNVIERDKARQALGLSSSEMVFLFFGLIRPYKGVPELIDAFNNISCSNSKLMIVGKVWTDSSQEFQELLERRLSNTNNIIFIPEFIPDDKLQLYFNACDIVVFPYKDILTSGAVLLAMSFGKACIAPRMGCIAEILDDNGAFFYDRHDESGFMKAIQLAKNKHSNLLHMGEYNLKLAQNYSWDRIAKMTFEVYEKCLI